MKKKLLVAALLSMAATGAIAQSSIDSLKTLGRLER